MEIKKTWDDLFNDDLWNEQWHQCWDDYAERFEVVSYWVKNKLGVSDQTTAGDQKKDEEELCDDTLFCSSGTGARIAAVAGEGLDGNFSGDEISGVKGDNNSGEDDIDCNYEDENSVSRVLDYGEGGLEVAANSSHRRKRGKYGQPIKSACV